MLSPHRIHAKNTNKRTKNPSTTNFDNSSHRERDLKVPRLTSKDIEDLERSQILLVKLNPFKVKTT